MPSEETKSRNYTQQTSSVAAIKDALVFLVVIPAGNLLFARAAPNACLAHL